MRVFRSFFLLMIATIVLLHSLMPHDHHDKTESEVCITEVQDGIFDWLALGLHMNQGEGHLEHFLKDKKATLNLDVVIIPCAFNPISFTTQLKEVTPLSFDSFIQNDHPLAGEYCQPHGLRAPPIA